MFFIYVIVLTLLQATVLKDLNLLVLLAVFAGLRKGPVGGLLIGGVIGMVFGFFSAAEFTLLLALYSIVGFTSGMVRAHIYYKENIFMEFMFSFGGVMLFYLGYFILRGILPESIFSIALFSAALSPILFRIVEKETMEVRHP